MCVDFSAEFQARPDLGPDDLPEFQAGQCRVTRRLYLDSFDWRLYRSGWILAAEPGATGWQLLLGERAGDRCWSLAVERLPVWAHELPAFKHREPLVAALAIRALQPRLGLTGERHEYRLAGPAETPELRLLLEHWSIESTAESLPPRWRLLGSRDERRSWRVWAERLREEFGLEPATDVLDTALLRLGVEAGDPSALPRIPLDPELRADAALRQVLRQLLHTIEINQAGVLAQTDTEFLHDFRVAVRRTRSVLGQIKEVFPASVTARFERGFAELAAMTSEARDLDVYLLDFAAQEALLPPELHGNLEPLRQLLEHRCASAHSRLNRYLGSSRYRRLIKAWRRHLDSAPPRRPRAARALRPIGELAATRSFKQFRRLVRRGAEIGPDSPPERLHQLRKIAKKLRYLLELFRSLYPQERLKPLVRALKQLQENLGEFQDTHVQIGHLWRYAEQLHQSGAPGPTLLAMGALLERLYGRERAVRGAFAERFAEFASEGNQRKFRHLFKALEPPADPP